MFFKYFLCIIFYLWVQLYLNIDAYPTLDLLRLKARSSSWSDDLAFNLEVQSSFLSSSTIACHKTRNLRAVMMSKLGNLKDSMIFPFQTLLAPSFITQIIFWFIYNPTHQPTKCLILFEKLFSSTSWRYLNNIII